MAGGAEVGDGRHAAATVEVVDRDVPEAGWQEIDLDRSLAELPARYPPSSGLAPSASVLAFPDRTADVGQPAGDKRIPDAAIVPIGRAGAPIRVRNHYPKRGIETSSANDNVAKAAGRTGSVWRDLFFLLLLAVTVIGAFWSGRVHGLQKVIVVPDAASIHSIVT